MFARHIWMNDTLQDAISAKRIHHQLLPMKVFYEDGFDAEIVDGLRQIGHNVEPDNALSAVTAISRVRGYVEAACDPRRYGSIAIY